MFRKAVDWGYLERNPASEVKALKMPQSPARFLSEEEICSLLDACSRSNQRDLLPIVLVALHTGMRRGEIMSLQWSDLDFKQRRINVVSRSEKSTKNYESRSIPMNKTVYAVLQSHPRQLHSPYLFSEADGRFCVNLNYEFPKAVDRAGIAHARFHDLRHTFASQLVMKRVDIRTVQVLMGHKSLQMTMKYAHLAPGHMRAAVEVLDGHYVDTGKEFSSDLATTKKTQPIELL
jgi:integrase